MAANPPAAYGIYASSAALHEVLQTLGKGGFEKDDICMMLSPTHPFVATVRESKCQPFEQVTRSSAPGVVAWLCEFGAVVIPTFGFFIKSRKFIHSLVTGRDAMAPGGSKTLVCLGFPEKDAERFENQVHEAGALLYLPCRDSVQTQWILDLLRNTGAKEMGLLGSEIGVGAAA